MKDVDKLSQVDITFKQYEELIKKVEARGVFIDWVLIHYPEVVKEYLGFDKIGEKDGNN